MSDEKYRLSYLPLFYDDLDEKVTYIATKLKNPQAANDLLEIDDDPNDLVMEIRRFLYNGQNQTKLV